MTSRLELPSCRSLIVLPLSCWVGRILIILIISMHLPGYGIVDLGTYRVERNMAYIEPGNLLHRPSLS